MEESWAAFQREFKRAEKLIVHSIALEALVFAKLARWAKQVADCKAAQTLKLEHGKKLNADCSRLQSLMLAVEEQLVAVQAKLMETDATIQQLEQHTYAD